MQENAEINRLPVVESDIRKVTFDDRLSELLGERFKEWKKGEIVFVQASTGLGKTYATLNYWYEYTVEQGVEMTVLVNRRLLKEQQWNDLRKHDLEMNRRKVKLHLFSYQNIEGSGEETRKRKKILEKSRYIVCDECHYFLADAMFNPGVQKSFDFLTSLYENATLIFLSATMMNIRPLIEKRIREIHQKKLYKLEKRKQSYEEDIVNDCFYRRDGSERGLAEFCDRLEQEKTSIEYESRMAFYEEQMLPPAVREYQFHRDISENIEVKYFREIDQLLNLIIGDISQEKWLIFVSSKKIGIKIRDKLMKKINDKKIVYVDAEYDGISGNNPYQEETQTEVLNIEKTGLFKCDILITTAVLDNGVNIKDSRVKNIVLMTEDETEFKQMLGRRRIVNQCEKLKLFIGAGNLGTFKKREKSYSKIYWKLCDNRDILVTKANEMFLEDYKRTADLLTSYYAFDGGKYHSNELAIEAVRQHYLYCHKVIQGMENDENFFVKEQLEWIGKNYTEEWANQANIGFSQADVDEISTLLQNLYSLQGILDEQMFKEFGQKLMGIAEKIDHKKFSDKTGSITTVNSALEIRKEWCHYKMISIGDRKTYYEILCDGEPRNKIQPEITPQKLRELVEEAQTDDMCAIYDKLFESNLPMCLSEDAEALRVFINNKLKEYSGLEDIILKLSGKGAMKRITVAKRPKSITKENKETY